MLDISELHQANTAKDALIAQLQTERDTLRRQLEQSETSRERYRDEVTQLRARIEELESAAPVDWEELHRQPEIKESLPASPTVPDDSKSFEDLVTLAGVSREKVIAQLEEKGRVIAGIKVWVRSADNPERFVVQPKAKRKDKNAG